jgi:ABC-type Co2+ transport system permease subunit
VLAFGDGGMTSFGANVFNMAVIGGLSFFLVKILLGRKISDKRLAASVFVSSWVSNIITLWRLVSKLEFILWLDKSEAQP